MDELNPFAAIVRRCMPPNAPDELWLKGSHAYGFHYAAEIAYTAASCGEMRHNIKRAGNYMRKAVGSRFLRVFLRSVKPAIPEHLIQDKNLVRDYQIRWINHLAAEWEANPRMLEGY